MSSQPRAPLPEGNLTAISTVKGPKERIRAESPRIFIDAMCDIQNMGTLYPSMAEEVFVEFVKRLYDVASDAFDRELWARVVGNLRSPLDVVDSNGKRIFTCPPMTGTLNLHQLAGAHLSKDLFHAKEQGERHPATGQRYLTNALVNYSTSMVPADITSVWKSILIRYGVLENDQKIGSQSNSVNLGFDDLEDEAI